MNGIFISSTLRIYQTIGKNMFSAGKNGILNTLEILRLLQNFLALGKSLNIYINYLMFYPSRQHAKWRHFMLYKFTFNNDFMMNRELSFVVTRNDFGNVLICWWVTLFSRVTYWGWVVEMNFSSIKFDKLLKIVSFPGSWITYNEKQSPRGVL